MKPAIRAENLSKRFRIRSSGGAGYRTLRDDLAAWAKTPWHWLRNGRPAHEEFWALKDVSFDVQPGEVVGIIGRNGAGKSTLLKILSRITRPTSGRVRLRGRVGSLLEVGTGFHPELSGRENIFLSGAVLGMRRAEIRRRFDEIVEFAGVERFLDMPVKRYSSGMYVRLAFAVAAHLEPEILIIDEVLAVGDAAFQKKCLGAMDQVAHAGRTVLFVSHQMSAVSQLCPRCILIDGGQLVASGPTSRILDKYLGDMLRAAEAVPLAQRLDRVGDGRMRFTSVRFETADGRETTVLRSGEDCQFVLEYRCREEVSPEDLYVSLALKDQAGGVLLLHQSNFENQRFDRVPERGCFVARIRRLPLTAGGYFLAIHLGRENVAYDSVENAARVAITAGGFFSTGHPGRPELCKTLIDCEWRIRSGDSVTPSDSDRLIALS